MKITQTKIPEVFIIEPSIFEDERGYFYESFQEKKYREYIGEVTFVQDNISRSAKNTLRGLHLQNAEYAQGKLCQVLLGAVLDVVVDIRFGSPTYGQYIFVELTSENKKQIWIPPGFAHGFSVLSDSVLFHYKRTNYYHKASERCLIYNDPTLHID
ncbi:MAG: dTDP-4-dehydrorhamnose 3,5-epimerase [Bacteroidota bacterium]